VVSDRGSTPLASTKMKEGCDITAFFLLYYEYHGLCPWFQRAYSYE
jgi:hypothetical protein